MRDKTTLAKRAGGSGKARQTRHHWLREQVGVAGFDRQKAPLVKRVGGSGRV